MRLFTCTIMLRGEMFQQIPNKVVTAPEILLLKHIHGSTAVFGVVPVAADYVPENNVDKKLLANGSGEERERLRIRYGRNPESKKPWADECWPGSIVKMPNSLEEIGMDAATQAADLRKAAERMLEEAKRLELEAAKGPEDEKKSPKKAA